jgi:type I restriction enzyme M protein
MATRSLKRKFLFHKNHMTPVTIVQKLWNYCNVLRDDDMSYGDYVEQLTRLLFLKVIKERTRPRKVYEGPIPKKYTC